MVPTHQADDDATDMIETVDTLSEGAEIRWNDRRERATVLSVHDSDITDGVTVHVETVRGAHYRITVGDGYRGDSVARRTSESYTGTDDYTDDDELDAIEVVATGDEVEPPVEVGDVWVTESALDDEDDELASEVVAVDREDMTVTVRHEGDAYADEHVMSYPEVTDRVERWGLTDVEIVDEPDEVVETPTLAERLDLDVDEAVDELTAPDEPLPDFDEYVAGDAELPDDDARLVTDGGEPADDEDDVVAEVPEVVEGDRLRIAYDSPQADDPVERVGEVVSVTSVVELVLDGDDADERRVNVSRRSPLRYDGNRLRVTSSLRPEGGETTLGNEWIHGSELGGLVDAEVVDEGEDEDDEPTTVSLREGETTDERAHARRNAEMLRMAERELDRGDDAATDGGRDAVQHFAAYVSGVIELDASVSLDSSAAVVRASTSALYDARTELESRGYDVDVDADREMLVVRPSDDDLRAVLDAEVPEPGEMIDVEDPVDRDDDELVTDGGEPNEPTRPCLRCGEPVGVSGWVAHVRGCGEPATEPSRLTSDGGFAAVDDGGAEWCDECQRFRLSCSHTGDGADVDVSVFDRLDMALGRLAPSTSTGATIEREGERLDVEVPAIADVGGDRRVASIEADELLRESEVERVARYDVVDEALSGMLGETADGDVVEVRIRDGELLTVDVEVLSMPEHAEPDEDEWRPRADELVDETTLARREAEVRALKELGLSHGAIADVLDVSRSTVDEYSSRINRRIDDAESTLDVLGVDRGDGVETDGGVAVGDGPVCHYCGESYEPTTSLERSYADDEDAHDVCSSCLFDVITDGAEIEPLPRFVDDEDDSELGIDVPETVEVKNMETIEGTVDVPTHFERTELSAWYGEIPDAWYVDRVFVFDGAVRAETYIAGGEWVEAVYQTENNSPTMSAETGWIAETLDAGRAPDERGDGPGRTVWVRESGPVAEDDEVDRGDGVETDGGTRTTPPTSPTDPIERFAGRADEHVEDGELPACSACESTALDLWMDEGAVSLWSVCVACGAERKIEDDHEDDDVDRGDGPATDGGIDVPEVVDVTAHVSGDGRLFCWFGRLDSDEATAVEARDDVDIERIEAAIMTELPDEWLDRAEARLPREGRRDGPAPRVAELKLGGGEHDVEVALALDADAVDAMTARERDRERGRILTDGGRPTPATPAELASRVEGLTVDAIGGGVNDEDAIHALGEVARVLSEDRDLDVSVTVEDAPEDGDGPEVRDSRGVRVELVDGDAAELDDEHGPALPLDYPVETSLPVELRTESATIEVSEPSPLGGRERDDRDAAIARLAEVADDLDDVADELRESFDDDDGGESA